MLPQIIHIGYEIPNLNLRVQTEVKIQRIVLEAPSHIDENKYQYFHQDCNILSNQEESNKKETLKSILERLMQTS